jgi:tripartite-type tricarboxylate transporter receptor subunit TctC
MLPVKKGFCIATSLVFSAHTSALAYSAYPTKPVRLLIPPPPAGGSDTLGRLLREGMQDMWVQSVVVDNRGGASGRLAAALAAKSALNGNRKSVTENFNTHRKGAKTRRKRKEELTFAIPLQPLRLCGKDFAPGCQ